MMEIHDAAQVAKAPPGTPDPISQDGRLAVRLPAGTKHATLRYRPAAFEWGALVSGLTLALGLAFALAKRLGLRGRPAIP